MDLSGDLPVLFSVFPDVSPFPQATVCTGNPGCFCTFPGKLKKRDIRLPVSGRSPGCLYLKCIPIHHQAGRIYDFVFSFTKFPEDMASSSSLYPLSGTGTYGNHHRAFCSFPKPAALFPALHSHRILYFIWRSMRSSPDKIHAGRYRCVSYPLSERKTLLSYHYSGSDLFLSRSRQSHRLNHHRNHPVHRNPPVQGTVLQPLPVQAHCRPV